MRLAKSCLLALLLAVVAAAPALSANLSMPSVTTTVVGRSDIPDCADTDGNHLNSTTGVLSCGSTPYEYVQTQVSVGGTASGFTFTGLTGTDYTLRCTLTPTLSGGDHLVQFSNDNGASWLSSNYSWMGSGVVASGATSSSGSASATGIYLRTTNTVNSTLSSVTTLTFYGLSESRIHGMTGKMLGNYAAAGYTAVEVSGYYNSTTTPVNAIRLLMSAGAWASDSRCTLYRHKTS